MPLFTPTGIQKLDNFQRQIEIIRDTPPPEEVKGQNSPSSKYSKQMASNAIEIINALKTNNNAAISDFNSLKKLMGNLNELIGHIDNKNFTGIPAVFNEESAKLAETFIQFLESLDFKKDFGTGISALIGLKRLGSKTTPEQAVQQHIVETKAKLKFYQKIVEAGSTNTKSGLLRHSVYQAIGDLKSQKQDDQPDMLSRLRSGKFKDEAAFKKEYEEKMGKLIEQIKTYPYAIIHADYPQYVNTEIPYSFDFRDIETTPIGYDLSLMLRNYEIRFNELLKGKSWSPVDTVQKELDKIFTAGAVKQRKDDIMCLYEEFRTQQMKYQSGDHLGMFKKVDPEKARLMQDVYKTMKETVEKDMQKPDRFNLSLLDVFKKLHTCANQNVEISKDKSIGECGRILRGFEFRVLDKMLDGTWGHDEKFYLKMHPKPAAPATAPKPTGP
ncbi:MAG TPA: hypothetical protein VLJ15_02170 [Gammaproteobacteria bacterium]|nr:hypothetical protein [Gammaproteobacteria bacterium]